MVIDSDPGLRAPAVNRGRALTVHHNRAVITPTLFYKVFRTSPTVCSTSNQAGVWWFYQTHSPAPPTPFFSAFHISYSMTASFLMQSYPPPLRGLFQTPPQ